MSDDIIARVHTLHKPYFDNCINACCSGEQCKNRSQLCMECGELWPCAATELVAELKTTRAQLEQRRIETVEQLKALKPRPDLINGVLIRAIGAPSFGAVFELNYDGTWNDFDATTPEGERTAPEDVPLPAFILWQPADAAEAVTDA